MQARHVPLEVTGSEQQTFEDFYRSYVDWSYRLAGLLTQNAAVGEEITQDAFISLHQRWDDITSPVPYLRRSLVNRANNWHRHNANKQAKLPLLAVSSHHGLDADELGELIRHILDRQAQSLPAPRLQLDDVTAGPVFRTISTSPGEDEAQERPTRWLRHLAGRRAATMATAAVLLVGLVAVVGLLGGPDRTATVQAGNDGVEERTTDPTAPGYNEGQSPSAAPSSTEQPDRAFTTFETQSVLFNAASVSINVAGRTFSPPVDDSTRAGSDPGDPTYTTLELEWTEHELPMRLFLYFGADDAQWWVDEIRISDGSSTGEWIEFRDGPYFKTALGSMFEGDVNLGDGQLIIDDLRLVGFTEPEVCTESEDQSDLALISSYPEISIMPGATGFGFGTLLVRCDVPSYHPVDLADYVIVATVADQRVVAIDSQLAGTLGETEWNLVVTGEIDVAEATTLTITAVHSATGTTVAELAIPVEILFDH